jgi:FkbH-like protein
MSMKSFGELKKNLKKDPAGLKKIKLALLGDTATQFLNIALRGQAFEAGYDLDVWEADFDQIERQVFDTGSELYEFQPDIVLIFQSTHKLLGRYNKLNASQRIGLAEERLALVTQLKEVLSANLGAKIIYYNYTETDDSVFGSYANNIASSFTYQLRKLNLQLMDFAMAHPEFFICDLSAVQNHFSRPVVFNPAVYVNTEMVLSIDVLPMVASRTIDIISGLYGQFKKCLILDLDNTTWGGIIGDDGIENIQLGFLGIGKAFTELQQWAKKLKDRGVILAVCSKNTESVAKEPFEKHPDMVLRLDDIAVFVANWENKADNIRQIQQVLNIGFDSMVFLDDNPFERNIVRENIKGICVPELPEDPANYLDYLYSLNLFETVSFSNEDIERTKLYQVEAQRNMVSLKYTNEDEFLQNLSMYSLVENFNAFNTPRVAQLSQRSNQFNLRTVRYTEADIARLASSPEHFTFAFTLADKFGDYGLICVIILQKENEETLFIDTWFMSCRVLKRGMENFVLNTIADFARERNFRYLKGEYLPTAKNEMVKDHYKGLGFSEHGTYWQLDTAAFETRKNHITKKITIDAEN